MKKALFFLLIVVLLVAGSGCLRTSSGNPTPLPTLIIIPSPTNPVSNGATTQPTPVIATQTIDLVTVTPNTGVPVPSSTATQGSSGIIPGTPSGPYVVVGVAPGDSLNIRNTAGSQAAVTGSFAAGTTTVMRTGSSSLVDGDLWVQVENPSGGTGWVNGIFLSEYVTQVNFCADVRVNALLTDLGQALIDRNGEKLAALVSPAHGVSISLWRYGTAHIFKQSDARWVFDSTFEHKWGAAPGSGLETTGSFQNVVLPKLQEVFKASYTLTCDSLGNAAQYGSDPWPKEFTGVNYYTVYKPGTPGVDLDWRYWLIGVEYIKGDPFIFAAIHFAWEP